MKRRIRVAYVLPSLRVGGTELQMLHLMRGLVTDVDVSLICTRSEGALIGDVRRIGAYVRTLDMRSGWDFRMEAHIGHILANHMPDVLHTSLFGFDLFANRAAREVGVPVIISSRRELPTWQRWRHLWMQRVANRYVDAVVANSQAVADYAIQQERLPASLVRVIPNGIDADAYLGHSPKVQIRKRYRIPPKSYIVGMVANFSPVKDHRLFVKMADQLLKRRQDIQFLLVGTGPLVDKVRRMVISKGHGQHFTRVSTVGEMGELLRVFDVAVLTSKMEGSPNAVMEAMANGTPVVAASVGGVQELIRDGETGFKIDTRNPNDFADKVEYLLDNYEAREAMGRAGAAWVREHRPVQNMVDAYKSLYFELLDQKLQRDG